jgi:Domain of unknown function (DUF5666)
LLNGRRSLKVGLASVVATAFVLAGSYGVADAAAPSFFHGHGRHFARTLSGTVTGVGSASFTLEVHHDRSLTVLTTSTTKFFETGSPVPVAGVTVGEHVVVFLAARHRPQPPVTSTTSTTAPVTAATLAMPTTTVTTSTTVPVTTTTAPMTTTSPPPLTAAAVYILLARESGRVSAVTSSTVTLGGEHDPGAFGAPHDPARTVELSSSTVYYEGGKSVSQTALTVGDFIAAYGNITGGVLDAVIVDIYPAHPKTTGKDVASGDKHSRDVKLSSTTRGVHFPAPGQESMGSNSKPGTPKSPPSTASNQMTTATVAGVVQAVSGDTIVVRSGSGAVLAVTVTPTTTFRDGGGQATLSDVVVGEPIQAYGVESAVHAFTASVVVIGAGPAVGQPAGWSRPQPETSPTGSGWGGASSPSSTSHNHGGSPRTSRRP